MLMQRLSASPIEWQEAEQELLLHLPPRGRRMARPLLGSAFAFAAMLLVVIYASDGWLPGLIGMGSVFAVFLSIAYLKMRTGYLTDMLVTITPERVIVKAIWGRHKTVNEFALKPRSRAWQWYSRGRVAAHASSPQGIVVAGWTYDPEAGDDPNDRSKPRFGGNLTPGEMDWVEWRVNLFLERNGHAAVPPSPKVEKPAAPRDSRLLVRIQQDQSETRIDFPNTVASGSYAGIGSILIGLVLLTFCCAPVILIWNESGQMSLPQWLLRLAFAGGLGILGLASTSNGLAQLIGRRRLTISPQSVRYRSSVLGFGVWWTLRTADILSVWDPSKHEASRRSDRDIAGAGCAVIRTARRQISLGGVLEALRSGGVDRKWLADEISRRIVAARAQAAAQVAVV
jgi:hypothetical protein